MPANTVMEATIYNKRNFHKNTFCIFNEVPVNELSTRKPNYKSKSGSQYFFCESGVFRVSNHWGRAANCKWRLQSNSESSESRTKAGFAKWTEFHRDNDTEKLYFIKADFESGIISFEHKESEDRNPIAILRTASETTKRIKQIRQLLAENAWTKYYPEQNAEMLTHHVINKLINSDLTLQQIKSQI